VEISMYFNDVLHLSKNLQYEISTFCRGAVVDVVGR
jgi:hypothetical protein